jgi:putative transcriptional regulator
MSRVGKLLIASPSFPPESPFAKSVIYIYQDDVQLGTVGVILNKPQETVSQHCNDVGIMFPDTQPKMHLGGPINPTSLLLLHTDDWYSSNTAEIGNGLRISSDGHMFFKIATGNEPVYWRAFYGLSAWRPGQLDQELSGVYPYSKNTWLLADATDEVVFDYDGDDQWIKAVDLCSQQTIDNFF